ncbi:MAG: hypothetical protein H7A00_01885 [Hahellaceae bacterium]|nr:hypothetical protein [Hahellaceae bacterium]MCP5160404.1 hypothetical protein [Hahellaceae bacterium]MCP5160406.1 hypothetical protein [Hahellaceae bacterium]
MKGLKKLALVSAISAASFAAQAELKSLDDATMGTLTGQAGVTIELETQVAVGEFRYTDEGTFAVSGITLGGAGAALGGTALLDDLYIDIDVETDGDAVLSIHSISGNPIDWGMSFASAELRGTDSTTLMSNFSAIGLLAQLDIRVDTATDTLIADVGFSVENLNVDVDFLAVGIRGLTVTGTNGGVGTGIGTGLAHFAFTQITMGTAANKDGVTSLAVSIPTFAADINIAAVEIGGTSIGSVAMDDLVVSNTSMVIYGH